MKKITTFITLILFVITGFGQEPQHFWISNSTLHSIQNVKSVEIVSYDVTIEAGEEKLTVRENAPNMPYAVQRMSYDIKGSVLTDSTVRSPGKDYNLKIYKYNGSGKLVESITKTQKMYRNNVPKISESSHFYEYDNEGKLSGTFAGSITTSIEYYPNDSLKSVKSSLGASSEYIYAGEYVKKEIQRRHDWTTEYKYEPHRNQPLIIDIVTSGPSVTYRYKVENKYSANNKLIEQTIYIKGFKKFYTQVKYRDTNNVSEVVVIEYNEKGYPNYTKKQSYEKFDSKGNWVLSSIYLNGKKIHVIERTIEYFK